jgi:hypothetical protein
MMKLLVYRIILSGIRFNSEFEVRLGFTFLRVLSRLFSQSFGNMVLSNLRRMYNHEIKPDPTIT